MNRVKPRKIMIKNIWCNIKTAKFYLTFINWLFRYTNSENTDNLTTILSYCYKFFKRKWWNYLLNLIRKHVFNVLLRYGI